MIRANAHRFGAIRTLASVGLVAIGVAASTAVPALAQASGTWTTTGNLNNPSSQGPLILLANGQVLTVGTGSAELYNPATGSWTITGSTATPRSGHTATNAPQRRSFGCWRIPR
jgi:hypothetical protein